MANTALIEDLLRQYAENPRRVFARLANELRKSGDYDRAIEICRGQIPQQPGYISGHIVLGQSLYDCGRLEEARQTFETALNLASGLVLILGGEGKGLRPRVAGAQRAVGAWCSPQLSRPRAWQRSRPVPPAKKHGWRFCAVWRNVPPCRTRDERSRPACKAPPESEGAEISQKARPRSREISGEKIVC
jgi:tetratricopeptide (TPR) repeat protein